MKSITSYFQIKKYIQSVFLVVVLLASLTGSIPAAQAQAGGAPALFSDAKNVSDAAMTKDVPAFVTRSRFVDVNLGLLLDSNGQTRDVSSNPEITLNLFPDTNYTGVIDRVEKNSEVSNSWIGKLKDNEYGYFYLVLSDGVFIAHVASPAGVYEISSAGDNLYQVIQIDQSKLPQEDIWNEENPVPAPVKAEDLGPNADSGAYIDVMVIYTQSARAAEGSVAAMNARIDLAMTETNTAYANAGVTPRLRLAYRGEVSYAESGDIGVDVGRLASTADGYMDQIHQLRSNYRADMVSLVVENGGGYCGMADAIMATAATAFQVTARSGCMTGYYSFGHEFGHLQGARHDTYVDPTNTPYAYGHGHVVIPTSDPRFRTVMAYNDRCADTAPYTYCNRMQFFSNPTKTYNGYPTGVSGTSEVYKVLNTTAVTVANFKTTDYICLEAVARHDFNVDCAQDIAVFRPSNGYWYVKDQFAVQYGGSGDIPVSGDYNGYGGTEYAVFRPSNGYWYIQGMSPVQYGGNGDIPVPGDYDGNGSTDIAVFRPSNGYWYVNGQFILQYGGSGDKPVPADYDGDGKTDVAVFRPSNGYWYVYNQFARQYGGSGDVPVPGDYNGDKVADVAVFRPSNGYWYVYNQYAVQYGGSGDIPVPGNYYGNGYSYPAVFRPSNGYWYIWGTSPIQHGGSGDTPNP